MGEETFFFFKKKKRIKMAVFHENDLFHGMLDFFFCFWIFVHGEIRAFFKDFSTNFANQTKTDSSMPGTYFWKQIGKPS